MSGSLREAAGGTSWGMYEAGAPAHLRVRAFLRMCVSVRVHARAWGLYVEAGQSPGIEKIN